jgi:hypothetical protein
MCIRGRVVKALRSGRSQLCWRGFESRRMHLIFICVVFSIKMEKDVDNSGI